MWIDLSYQDNGFRKPIILCCRALTVPPPGSNSLLAVQVGTPATTESPPQKHYQFLLKYQEYVTSPTYAALVLEIARSAPYTRTQEYKIRQFAFCKELRTLEGTPLPSRLNYSVWFDPDCIDHTFHSSLPPNPDMAYYVQKILLKWRLWMTTRTHYPRTSGKQISWDTVRNWEEHSGERWGRHTDDRNMIFSQKTLLRYYFDTGIQIPGRCEMRQKWYRSGVAPRTYYAMGGSAYWASCYLQDGWNKLVDLSPVTNHVSRLNPSRIKILSGEYLRIYDLSTFTSNHHEQKHFLSALASWCSGYDIVLADPKYGLMTYDLGYLISLYTAENINVPYSLERMRPDFDPGWDFFSCIASLLGIYGNLMTCTFVHGHSVLQAPRLNTDNYNCAGDDGHFAEEPGLEDETTGIIRANGVIEETKEFATYEPGAVCLKRSTEQVGNKVIQSHMLIWPSIAILDYHLGRSSTHAETSTLNRTEWRNVIGKEILRFLHSIFSYQYCEDPQEVLEAVQSWYLLCSLDPLGSLSQTGGSLDMLPVMPETISDLYKNPLEVLINRTYTGAVILPERSDSQINPPPADLWRPGLKWSGTSNPGLKMLSAVGVVEKEVQKRIFFGMEGLYRLKKEFDNPGFRVNEYEVVSVPSYDVNTLW